MNKIHNDQNQLNSRKSPSTVMQPDDHDSAAPQGATDPQVQEPTLKALHWYYENERLAFLPIKVPIDWDDEKDKQEFIGTWGESEDYAGDTQTLLKDDLAKVHAILEVGINYFSAKRQARLVLPPSVLNVREKVALFTELLPASANHHSTLRFSMILARIIWLESERERITQHPDNHRWLFPFYRLADCFLDAACELEEGLGCEHRDFRQFALAQED